MESWEFTNRGLEWNTGPCPFCGKPVKEDQKMEHLAAKHPHAWKSASKFDPYVESVKRVVSSI